MAKIKDIDEEINTSDSPQEFLGETSRNSAKSSGYGKGMAGVFAVIVVVAVLWFGYKLFSGNSPVFSGSNTYQAVFLDNNQVYFGKLSQENSDSPVLRDIFYLRASQPLQPPPVGQAVLPDISLIKLGSELHGPEDEMRINREHILFIENLREDGQVVTAIKAFKEAQAQQ